MKITYSQLKKVIKESLEGFSPLLRDEIARAKSRGVSRNDVNSVLARGGADEQLALEISILRRTLKESEEVAMPGNQGFVDFIVRSNQIEGYAVDPQEVSDAIEGFESGYPLTYVTNNPHIYSHLAGIQAAKKGATSVSDVVRIHGAMGADALDAGAPGVLRSGVEAQSAGGTKYVPSANVPEALSWWSKQGWSNPFEAHTVYELIHPFADGNGRSGRIILAAMVGFNYSTVNGLIGSGYFSNLDSVGSKYQGEFWRDDTDLREHVRMLLREAEGEGASCPIRGAWYGGIPSGGGFGPHKEYTVGAQQYAEAAHCILGSLGRRVGAPGKTEWHSMMVGERAHLLEEIGIMQKVINEYSHDLYIAQINDITRYREDAREEIAEWNQGAIDDIKKMAPKLEAKATANLQRLIAIKEAEPEFPDSVYKVALYTYQCLGLLARAMLASIEGWDEEAGTGLDPAKNAFKNSKLIVRTNLLEQAIDDMIQDLS